jgi:hypothetical protein
MMNVRLVMEAIRMYRGLGSDLNVDLESRRDAEIGAFRVLHQDSHSSLNQVAIL